MRGDLRREDAWNVARMRCPPPLESSSIVSTDLTDALKHPTCRHADPRVGERLHFQGLQFDAQGGPSPSLLQACSGRRYEDALLAEWEARDWSFAEVSDPFEALALLKVRGLLTREVMPAPATDTSAIH